ncbi:MAG: class I SAM-dependent methyltransferase [Saprospiraceae bacterium]|nr:class I SAM-dependent methyltransferase [Saprospiraceae bacterium]
MLKSLYRFLSPRFQTLFLEYKVSFQPRYGHGLPAHGGLLEIIEKQRSTYQFWLEKINSKAVALQNIKKRAEEKDATQPGWNNGFLPGLDIMALYTIIAETKPKRYVEVGSGNSTKVAHKAIRDHGLSTKISSIDPFPRAEIDHLADEVVRRPFESVDTRWLAELEAGDILFIDNSHRMLPNSDATVFFLETLPALRPGVIVHIHDIYLPYDYPQFMCDRFYSEQYGLAIAVQANPKRYKTIFPAYFVSEDADLRAVIAEIWNHPNLTDVERHGGSYWLEIGQD